MVTGSRDRTARLWDLNVDSLIDRARRLAGRQLTPKEKEQHQVELTLRDKASLLVNSLSFKYLLKRDLINAVLDDNTLSEPLQKEAVAVANGFQEDPVHLAKASEYLVQRADQTNEQYSKALLMADIADKLRPDNGACLYTLGAAHYRLGQHGEAVAALSRSDEIFSGLRPEPKVFLAMALYQLDQNVEAEKHLRHLRELMRTSPWNSTSSLRQLFREAEALIKPAIIPK